MKNKVEKVKTAYDKAKSGLLPVTGGDVDALLSHNVNNLPDAPGAIKDCGSEVGALSHGTFRPPTRLSSSFIRKVNHRHDDLGFLLLALTMQDPYALTPTAYACC